MSHETAALWVITFLLTLCFPVTQSYSHCYHGKCDTQTQCCNVKSYFSKCCPMESKCCYNGPWTRCCGLMDTCCWGYHYQGVACCPPGFKCCGQGRHKRRAGCCWKTPVYIWILVAVCASIIVVLLCMSLYQCINDQLDEYNYQRQTGILPAENAWYYYDYGTGVRTRPESEAQPNRVPPAYEPPPRYRPPSRNSQQPKPPTPQAGRNRAGEAGGGRSRSAGESEYHSTHSEQSLYHECEDDSTPGSDGATTTDSTSASVAPTPSEVRTEVIQTLHEHAVPRLIRLLCTKHSCTTGDGSCVYCMDQEQTTSDLENEYKRNDINNNTTRTLTVINYQGNSPT